MIEMSDTERVLSQDADRILDQIARGEVRAGPDAARAIAARHQAAYGDVWDRQATGADAANTLASTTRKDVRP